MTIGRKSNNAVFKESFATEAGVLANGGVFVDPFSAGNPTFSNGAMNLNGSSYVEFPDFRFELGSKPKTIRIRQKRTTETGGRLVQLENTVANKTYSLIDFRSGSTVFYYTDTRTTSNSYSNLSLRPPLDEWSTVVITFDGTSHYYYVDGTLRAQAIPTTPWVTFTNLKIGSGGLTGGGGLQPFTGSVKDLLITASYWTAQEVLDYMNNATYNFLDKSSLYFPLNTESGAGPFTTPDLSSHGRLASYSGANAPTKLTDRNGYSFDGVNDYMTFDSPGISGNAEFTMWAWVKPQDLTTVGGILTIGNISTALNAAGLFANISGGGELSIEFAGGNGWRTTAGALKAGEPFLLSASKTAGAINTTTKLYKNGVELSCSGSASTPNIDATKNGVVGSFATSSNYFKGDIYQCGILPFAITATQHRELYNRGVKYLGSR